MKLRFFNLSRIAFTLALLSIITITACSNSVSHDDDHEEPAGFRLKLNGSTVVEQLPNSDVTGSLVVQQGQETALISFYLIAEDGDEFQPTDSELSLGHSFSTSGVAEFEQHAEDGKWNFHIHGEAAGSTNLTLQLMHEGHSDFNTQAILVEVTAATAAQ
jgi:hypothetical protein